MAFQWVFDKAESISVNKRAIVGQTITRNQTVRAVSRGNAIKRYTVKLPDMVWSEVATYIAALDAAGRFTKETIKLDNAGYNSWMDHGDINNTDTVSVLCVTFPDWTISARNIVSWSGPFVFFEARV
jgi:hypothetical protein